MIPCRRFSIGLALGGGAMLGAAHVGVLRVIEELGLNVTALSGTSIGALVSALYAFEVPVDEIEATALELDWKDIGGLKLSRLGLFSNRKMGSFITERLGNVRIEDAPRALSIVATDVASGKKVILKEGSVASAVMASTCVPGVFAPVMHEGQWLVDGGLVENVPVSVLDESTYDYLVAVDLSTKRQYSPPEDVFDVMANAVDIAINNYTRIQLTKADCLIQPDLASLSRVRADRSDVQKMINHGYDVAKACLGARMGWRQFTRVMGRKVRQVVWH